MHVLNLPMFCCFLLYSVGVTFVDSLPLILPVEHGNMHEF